MLVAIPTAIPDDPFTSKFGNLEGRTVGSSRRPSKFGMNAYGLLFDVLEHLDRDSSHPCFGVA